VSVKSGKDHTDKILQMSEETYAQEAGNQLSEKGHEGISASSIHAKELIDYVEELRKAFNQDGKERFNEENHWGTSVTEDEEVKNPVRRGDKHKDAYKEKIRNEPSSEDRRRVTERILLEGPNESVRINLYEWYHGKCQICGETWPKRDGSPFFAAAYLVERRHARWIDEPGNAICLCAEHFAQWRHAAKITSDVINQINNMRLKAEGGDGKLVIHFSMFGEGYTISFGERHLLELRKLVEVAGQS